MNMLSSQGQALANFGTWQWDIAKNKVTWSDVLYDIYGLDKKTVNATLEGYAKHLHPDDRERVLRTIQDARTSDQDTVFEERIIRPGGGVRYLRSWTRAIKNSQGQVIKMIGAGLDITHAKTTQLKMDEIAWLQSHVIRAPLARLMGLVNVLQHHPDPNEHKNLELLSNIIHTAQELDSVIHNITANTKR